MHQCEHDTRSKKYLKKREHSIAGTASWGEVPFKVSGPDEENTKIALHVNMLQIKVTLLLLECAPLANAGGFVCKLGRGKRKRTFFFSLVSFGQKIHTFGIACLDH